MTIKQQGGVFGRNPTFNDVTIEGQLTFDGDIDVNSDLKVDGNLEVTGSADLTGGLSVSNDTVDLAGNSSLVLRNGTLLSPSSGYLKDAFLGNVDGVMTYAINGASNGAYGQQSFIVRKGDSSDPLEAIRLKTNGDVSLPTGNLVVINGKGIDFSATAGAGSTSELLDDYEEGDWTPVNGTWGTLNVLKAQYTKIGNTVHLFAQVTGDSTTTIAIDSNSLMTGIPFAPDSASPGGLGGTLQYYGSHGGNLNALADVTINGVTLDMEVIVLRGTFTYGQCLTITLNLTYKVA